jgi:hypothetical protein
MEETLHTIESLTRQREREDMAGEMIADGEPMDKIKKYTKLTEEEVNAIAKTAKRAA